MPHATRPPRCTRTTRPARMTAPAHGRQGPQPSRAWADPENLRFLLDWKPPVQRQPLSDEDWRSLGRWFRSHDPSPELVAAYREALQRDPELPDGWYTLGVLLHQQGEYSEAVAAFQEGLRREPDRADVWYALRVTCVAQGDRVRAREVYERLGELDAAQAQKFLRDELQP